MTSDQTIILRHPVNKSDRSPDWNYETKDDIDYFFNRFHNWRAERLLLFRVLVHSNLWCPSHSGLFAKKVPFNIKRGVFLFPAQYKSALKASSPPMGLNSNFQTLNKFQFVRGGRETLVDILLVTAIWNFNSKSFGI